jgi:putative ATPase
VQAYKSEEDRSGEYRYPHNFGGYVRQQYLPDGIKDKEFYIPLSNGKEKGYIKKKKQI